MKTLSLPIQKSAEALRLSLQKRGVTNPPNAEVAFDLDVSGSFDDEHRDGLTQQLLDRLVPWGVVFDPDHKLDVFTFSDGEGRSHHVGDLTPATSERFIARQIIGRVPGYGNGTNYSYVLEANLRHFGRISTDADAPKFKPKLLSRLFGGGGNDASNAPAPVPAKKRSIVLFVTDGDNSDKTRTEEILAESEQRRDEVYFLFIAISNQGGKFPFLDEIGRRFSNTGLVVINDLPGFVQKTDEGINDLLIGEELVEWLKR